MDIDLRPNPAFFPAGAALIDTVPFAILFGQFSPLRTGAQYPVDAFYETTTMLLIGGDKTGNDRFYEEYVPVADDLYDENLEELRKEGLIE